MKKQKKYSVLEFTGNVLVITPIIAIVAISLLTFGSCNNDDDVPPPIPDTDVQDPDSMGDDDPADDPNVDNQAPEPFNLIKVTDGAMDIDVLPEFTWQPATDPEGDAVTYDLYLGSEADPMLYEANLSVPSFQVQERLSLYASSCFRQWDTLEKFVNGLDQSFLILIHF